MKSLHYNARLIFALWLAATIALGTKPLSAFEDSPAALTFEKDVRPIFKAHCFLCHGEEADLRGKLDLRLVRLIQQGGESGTAIVPGDHESSLLVNRIQSNEMPPGPKKLTEAEKNSASGRGSRFESPSRRSRRDMRFPIRSTDFLPQNLQGKASAFHRKPIVRR
jgi:mono/diheme cytochrome c family protein